MRVFPKAIVLTTKSHFDVKKTYASIRGLVVRTIALGKTRISAKKGLYSKRRILVYRLGSESILWYIYWTNEFAWNRKKICFCSAGSVGVDYLITFSDVNGVSVENLRQELQGDLNLSNNGAFIGGSTFKVSNKTNSSEVAMEFIFQGK